MESEGVPVGRRVVLGMLGLGAVGVLFGSKVTDTVNGLFSPLGAALPAAGGFRIYTVTGSLPARSEAEYRLKVTGLVDRPLELTVADLRAMPRTRFVKDFQCVTGWRVPDVPWTGVALSALLDAAGVQAAGKALRFVSFDGAYTESLTLEQARRPDMVVAYEMYDKPVTRAHGGPVRLYTAPMYGYKSCKWLAEIEVTPRVVPGYWELRGYDIDAWIGKSNGRDDAPVD
ncbi:MAG TPA: molybdopterin-dependent oxidoreductase [Acidimicrobiales bacterium]|nr:molybdopterin-dependent oxidoreductase [Acidimicrobiales bacterium]